MSRGGYNSLGDGTAAPLLASSGGGAELPGSRPGVSQSLGDEAPVDEGFAAGTSGAAALERGRVTVRPGAADMDLSALQQPLTSGQVVRSAAATVLALALPLVGWGYLLSKFTVVRPGEIALARSITGETRALGQGCHLAATVGTEVKKASVTEPVVTSGTLSILRVLPGDLGRGQLNGAPLLLGPGVHLINDVRAHRRMHAPRAPRARAACVRRVFAPRLGARARAAHTRRTSARPLAPPCHLAAALHL